MKIKILILLLAVVLVQCKKENDTLIAKNEVGPLNKYTEFLEVENIFKKDSIVKSPEENATSLQIYRNGKKILIVNKNIENDSIKTIESVQVFSDKYTTERGLSTASTFKDINNNYSIKKVEPTFTSAVVFIDELNMTVALNKKDLNIDEFDMRKISKDQIPDMAKIKSITIWFD